MVYLVLLEQLTRKKLLIFLGCLVIIQIIYFLIGGLVGTFHDFYLYELILLFLGTKPTHATNHEFSLCQSKGSNQWISTLHGNCEEAHLDFGSV